MLLLIAEGGSPIEVLADQARIVRLGQGISQSAALAPEAISRALEVLCDYTNEIRRLCATPFAVGTQALREAPNAQAFLEPASEILGCEIEVIGGMREAELAWRAASQSFPDLRDAVVLDIGGGSTEIVVARAAQVERKLSTKLGSVRLHERFLKHDPPLPEELDALEASIERELARLDPPLPRGLPLVGIAGTVTTLAAMERKVDPYDPERVHGSRLGEAAIAAQIERLRSAPLEQRKRMAGLDPARADVILAGAILALHLVRALGVAELRVSDRGVRWGLLYEKLDLAE